MAAIEHVFSKKSAFTLSFNQAMPKTQQIDHGLCSDMHRWVEDAPLTQHCPFKALWRRPQTTA
jgi:hypothetical protein